MRRSIVRRVLGGAALLLLAASVVVSLLIEGMLRDESDWSLLSRAQSLAANVEQEAAGIEFDLPDGLMLAYAREREADYFQLWAGAGDTLERSPSLAGASLPLPPESARPVRFASLVLPDGRPGRAVYTRFAPRLDTPDEEDRAAGVAAENPFPEGFVAPQLVLAVAVSDQSHLDLVVQMRLTLALFAVLMLAGLALLLRHGLDRGLQPLDDIRRKIAALDADKLQSRLQPGQPTAELREMIEQFNRLLERLEQAFRHERQFSHDVAHELRTPLAELRNIAEVGSKWPGDEQLVRRFFGDVLGATAHMERTVDNLLALARCEREMELVDDTPFDVVPLIRSAWRRVGADGGDDRRELILGGEPQCQLPRGADQWSRILHNLLANAVDYSPPGSVVEVAVACSGGRFAIDICNRAEGLTEADTGRMFDRLWRKDGARADQHHCGLGLALVKAYAGQLQVDIGAVLAAHGELTVSLGGQAAPAQRMAAAVEPVPAARKHTA